jgi:hypothetical protein
VARFRSASPLLLVLLWLACRSSAPTPAALERPVAQPDLRQSTARVRSVEVRAAAEGWSAAQRRLLERQAVAAQVRESALDWLDARHRFDPKGSISVLVELSELRLRSAFTALVFAGLTGGDRLAAQVDVYERGAPVARYAMRVDSALGGLDSWNPRERLARLARMLGRRVADAL